MNGDANTIGRPSAELEALFRAHVRYVWRSLRFLGVPERDIQDAGQEVFMVVFRKLSELRTDEGFRTWLYRTCWRVASDWRRRAYQRRAVLDGRLEEPGTGPAERDDPEAHVDRQRRQDRLLAALATMDETQRDVFVLYEIEDLAMKEIAGIMGVPLPTAYDRLRTARRKLQQVWAEVHDDREEMADG